MSAHVTDRSNLIETITITSNPERKVEVFFAPEEEDIGVRGNISVSGDDVFDRTVEDAVIERLEYGDIWAWFRAHVVVTTSVEGVPFTGHAYLGGCSYDDRDDFMESAADYLRDLRDEALADLRTELNRVIKRSEHASTLLNELEGETK